MKKSWNQFINGEFTDDVTLLGTVAQIVTGLFGVDAPMDARDIAASVKKGDLKGVAINSIGFIPGIGVFKYSDEVGELVQGAGKVVKNSDEVADAVSDVAKNVSKTSSKKLRENLIKAGRKVPDYPNAAHNIVAGNSPKASKARQILEKYGMEINDAVNGVFLPTTKRASGAYHPSIHTNAYYDEVTNLLSEATCKQDVIDILNDIASQLSQGTFMN